MDEDEYRNQVSQDSMEDNMETMKDGAGKAADATKKVAKFTGEKLKSSKMAQQIQRAKEKAKAKAKAVAKETAKGTEKVIRGATTLGAGAALAGTGAATQAAGAAMSAAGQAITGATLGFGAAVGEAMDAMGKAMQEGGKTMVNTGKKVMKHGTKTMKKGAEQIAKAPMAEPGKSSGMGGAGNKGLPKMDIPFIGKKSSKDKKHDAKRVLRFAKDHPILTAIIISAIFVLLVMIFVVLSTSSKVSRGKHKDGDKSNVPYVVTEQVLGSMEIFPDGNGGFTYGFLDENGNALTLDEALDNVLKTLRDNNSSAYGDMGNTDEERKEFLKLLIQAEVATQYPDLSINGTGTSARYTTGTGMTSSSTGKDYVVSTTAANAATVLSEEDLKKAVNNSTLSDAAKQNVIDVIPDLVRYQEQYHVNALFIIAVAKKESTCGTCWDLIDPSTYNWLSVKGNANGGYVDRAGTSWNKYGSFSEASEAWFKLISSGGPYFRDGKVSVRNIAPTYCDAAWGEQVVDYMEEFYGYAGADGNQQVAAITNTSTSASPAQSQANVAEWGWVIQNENINAYYYEHGYGTITYNSYGVDGYITQDGRNYIVVSNSTGWYAGQGVQLYSGGSWNTFNTDLLRNHGVDVSSIQVGSTIDADTVDMVSREIFQYKKNEIQSQAMSMGITLTENQIVALVDISYLNGNVNAQLNNIKTYGANSDQLANTAGFQACGENETPTTRAQVVWKLFHYGKYEARSGNPYDPSYFGGLPQDTTNTGSGNSHGGTATAGERDSNGVTITANGNIDFLNYAIDCHKLLREDGFYYWNGGREMPVVRGDSQHTIDCVAYVSMALDCYGRKDWQYYPHQLTVDSCVEYGKDKLETIYEGSASSINEIPDLQSGDIVIMPGHGQIFYGYADNGDPVWLNCGGNESINTVEGQGGWYATPILYVFRVPGGSGNSYSRRASQLLTGNEDSVQGKIKIKRKDDSGNEVVLEYVDEATFDNLIATNNPDVMNVYTLKRGNNTNNTNNTTGSPSLSGSETKEQIWNYLVGSGLTEQGAAALMGNLEAESGCKSVRVQGDYNYPNAAEYSQNYTDQVDNGTVTKDQFVNNGPGGGGYGLAQWTDPGRKEKLYDYAKSKGTSIGDLQTQLEYLIKELSTESYYSSIWTMITTTTDINSACDLILRRFENPADIDGNIPVRRENAATIYATYHGNSSSGNNSGNTNSGNTNQTNNSSSGLVKGSHTFSNGDTWEYYLYIPENPDPNKPFVVYQHGRRSEGDTSVEVLKNGGDQGWAYLSANQGETFDYYVLEPRIPAETGWIDTDTAKLHELIEDVKSQYSIITENVSLWGFSMGAERIEFNLHAYPGYYSSVVILGRAASDVQSPATTNDFANIPVVIEYGEADNYSKTGSPALGNNLRNAGVNVLVKSQGNFGHGNTLTRAIHDSDVMNFITNGSSATTTTTTSSFDDFLFVGDSRYYGISSELRGLGSNVSVCAVSGSTPEQWDAIIDSGSGSVNGTNITLPGAASGVSVMLGANAGASQINQLKEVMQKLHTRYPNAVIYFNSVYHVGSNYTYANKDDTNAGYDNVNEEMRNFCGSNDWAEYVDITEGLHDENGYLKYPDGEGIHLVDEGKTILVNNIKNNIRGANNSSSSSSSSNESSSGNNASSQYVIAVASYDKKDVVSVDSYQYAYTKVISTSSGTVGYGTQFSLLPAYYLTSNSELRYKTTYADYQPAVKNHTLYFDFLWALFIQSGDKKLVEEMANEAINSTLEITVYSDTKVNQNVETRTIQPQVRYKLEGTTAYEDHYNGINTTTITNTIVSSKACLTIANVWNMEYKNEADNYSEFKSKVKERSREKIEDNDNIMLILRKNDRATIIKKDIYLLERMLEENNKVSHLFDIFKYFIEIAAKSTKNDADVIGGNYIDTRLFDLSNTQSVSTVNVLLYTSLNITDSEREQLYKAVEQITSGFPDDEENTKRKKYVASVILNRALISKFPDTVSGVLNQGGQFINYNSATVNSVTASDATKAAVDSVVYGGDCSNYSVYFNTPGGAAALSWDTKFTKVLNDGNDAANSYSYYTDDSMVEELKRYEVSVAPGTTVPTDAAKEVVRWAENQVGKSSFKNKSTGNNMASKEYSAAFVQCAYNEAGLGYMGVSAKDLPHDKPIQFNNDGTINYSKIPIGAIIVSEGINGSGHVCLYVGNGYVIEAGGDVITKTPIDDSLGGKDHACAPFIGWGYAMSDQELADSRLVVRIGNGGIYGEGWTPNDDATRQSTGIEGYYVVNGRQYNVYCQGGNDVWGPMAYSMGTYGSSACGATSVAIICSGTDSNITPIETGKSAYEYAGCAFGSRTQRVTECGALTKALQDAGLRSEWKSPTKDEVIAHLQSGQPVIVLLHSNRAGNITYGGHYVTLLGINNQGEIFLGDPARAGGNTGYFDQSMFDIPAGGVCFVYYD